MRWVFALCVMLGSMSAEANRFYGEVQLGMASVRHSDTNFYPSFGSLSAGLFVRKNIGIELFVDQGISQYSTGDFDLEIKQAHGAALRLQSPPQGNVNAYFLLGFVSFLVDQTVENTQGDSVISERFEGARVSVGVQQRLKRFPAVLIGAEYRHYNSDTRLSVDGLGLSLRVNVK